MASGAGQHEDCMSFRALTPPQTGQKAYSNRKGLPIQFASESQDHISSKHEPRAKQLQANDLQDGSQHHAA